MSDSARPDRAIPFDTERLDQLLDEASIDVLLVTSKHNLQYMLGGYRFFFFSHTDAIGQSRYLPVLVYRKGAPDKAAYFGHPMESYEEENRVFWVPEFQAGFRGTAEPIRAAIAHVRSLGIPQPRLGVETAFLPFDAGTMLRDAFSEGCLADALVPLERLRARKTPGELALLREATEKVAESMLAVIAGHGPGTARKRPGGWSSSTA
jgi:Xaa-Pro aminopeptidase